jgi:two-component system response regulator NreC
MELAPAGPRTVVVADDHAVVRAGVGLLVSREETLEVVLETSTLGETSAAVTRLRPDVLLLDLHMAGEFTLPALPALLRASPGTAVLVLTMAREHGYAVEALAAGARGFVRKDAVEDELLLALRAVACGRTYLEAELGATLALADRPVEPDDGLTDRQRDVLTLLAAGRTNRQISQELYVSLRSVESVRAQLRSRLGLSSHAELVLYAHTHGLAPACGASPGPSA